MSQNTLTIANDTAPTVRVSINNALETLASNHSGPSAPSETVANMLWYDTDDNTLKMRNEVNGNWLTLFRLDQSGGEMNIITGTPIVSVGGGSLNAELTTLTDSSWENGTETKKALVSPSQAKGLVESKSLGYEQSWQNVIGSRSSNTTYQNTTGKPIVVNVQPTSLGAGNSLQVSTNGSSWVSMATSGAVELFQQTTIVPPTHYYRLTGSSPQTWVELR